MGDADAPDYFDRLLEVGRPGGDGGGQQQPPAATLTVKQCYVGDVGCVVWDAALVLCKYLESEVFGADYGGLARRRVVELGAGTGAVGLAAGVLGGLVTITDLDELLPLMQLNIDTNQTHIQGSLMAKSLKWGAPVDEFLPHPDLILMSDCVYYLEAVDDLVKTLGDLSGPNTLILCSYEERTIGQNLKSLNRFLALVKEHFVVEEVPLAKQDPVYRSEDIHILTMKKL